MNKRIFYVYIHYKKSDKTPFYIGKGKKQRYKDTYHRNKYWQNIANKHGWYHRIYKEGLLEDEALQLEEELIRKYKKKYKLANLTLGGKGRNGYKMSLNEIQKLKDCHGLTDRAVYSFININGECYTGIRSEFASKYNMRSSSMTRMIKHHKTSKGWYVEGLSTKEEALNPVKTGSRKNRADKTIYSFINIDTNETFKGAKFEFRDHTGISSSSVNKIIKGGSYKKWKLTDSDLKKTIPSWLFSQKGRTHPRVNTEIKKIFNDELDTCFEGTWFEFSEKFNINRKYASEFFKGRKKKCYGWRLI